MEMSYVCSFVGGKFGGTEKKRIAVRFLGEKKTNTIGSLLHRGLHSKDKEKDS